MLLAAAVADDGLELLAAAVNGGRQELLVSARPVAGATSSISPGGYRLIWLGAQRWRMALGFAYLV